MAERRHPNVVNVAEVEGRSFSQGSRFSATSRRLGLPTGGRQLGCSWYEVPAGKVAFPFHFHCANEEAVFVLEGEGSMRMGADTVAVGPGDYIAHPVGPEHAHQLRNTGAGPLRYLVFSTMHLAEVVGYPDSKKIGAMASPSIEASARGEPWIRQLAFQSSAVGYYDGEDLG